MHRSEIINYIIQRTKARAYLEVGVGHGRNFRRIRCPIRIGVEPEPNAKVFRRFRKLLVHKTSDEFFEANNDTFDVIFIDGLHHADQVEKDILNSLKILNDKGTIICHDMNPQHQRHQITPQQAGHWNGDCWKAWVKLRSRPDLEMYVVRDDEGCGVIQRGMQNTIDIDDADLNWGNLCKHRSEWLNIIPVEEFKARYI
jgi:hypothetical protein